MSFCTPPTMTPHSQPELTCPRGVWGRLLLDLRQRSHFGQHESGAFLLGTRTLNHARILHAVLYDDLDPHSLDRGIVHFDGRYYGALWDRCRTMNLIVVADVHTHPFGSQQSPSDRAHPMIASEGHIALIVPHFAMRDVSIEEIGMYRYVSGRRWSTVLISQRADFLRIES